MGDVASHERETIGKSSGSDQDVGIRYELALLSEVGVDLGCSDDDGVCEGQYISGYIVPSDAALVKRLWRE